ncbi:predicted protein [Plenodomus lingam JN3]|uniref:Uncharacterized protein n=2 Tax=Leptosphaeria maculans TaxID=5022 RepID=E5A6Y5_LEPMJ|nr:predicted protein [Plenodomus lingam JN3]CBX99380.1 predicted protein [Plenodomus lingam JN3]
MHVGTTAGAWVAQRAVFAKQNHLTDTTLQAVPADNDGDMRSNNVLLIEEAPRVRV